MSVQRKQFGSTMISILPLPWLKKSNEMFLGDKKSLKENAIGQFERKCKGD